MRWRYERLAVSLIIVGAVSLALAWALVVPIFQEPDENAHANYAFTVYTSHRLVTASEGRPGIDTHPFVRYLEQKSGYREMRYTLEGRAPTGYGTPDYFRSVDAGAPTVPSDLVARTGRIPDLLTEYAYLYYGLVALAMGIGGWLSGGSLTSAFFFGRGLSIACLACSLLFAYGIFREMHVTPVRRVALLAAVAFLPLTIWVSAYIQPDNLAFTIVAMALYLGLLLRRRAWTLRSSLLLGTALGLLWLTKVQYFAAVALPLSAAFAVTARGQRRSVRFWALNVLCIALPLVVAFVSDAAISKGTASTSGAYLTTFGDAFTLAKQGGLSTLAPYVGHEIQAWYVQTFVWGRGLFTYWSGFGYIPSPIFRGPPEAVSLLWFVLSGLSTVVGVLLAVRCIRVLARLARVARRRSIGTASRILFSDAVLNSYFLFAVILAIAFVESAGRLGQFGRYWLPFQPATVLCATYYAPQALRRPAARIVSNVMTALLLTYALIAAIAGIGALRARYYAPPSEHSSTEGMAYIDEINYRSVRPEPGATLVVPTFPPSGTVSVTGWAVDSRAGEPARRVDVVVDGVRQVEAHYGLRYCDKLVDVPFFDDRLVNCGFSVRLPLSGLSPGTHTLSLLVYESGRAKPYPSTSSTPILVKRP